MTPGGISTDDQKLSSQIHGEALKVARDEVPQKLLDRLAAAAEVSCLTAPSGPGCLAS